MRPVERANDELRVGFDAVFKTRWRCAEQGGDPAQ